MVMAGQVNSIFGSKSFVELPSQGWLIFNFRLGSETAQLNESRMIVCDGLIVPLLQVRKSVSQVLSNSPRKESSVESPNELIPCVSLSSAGPGHALPPFVSLCIKVERGDSDSVSIRSNAHGVEDLCESPQPFL